MTASRKYKLLGFEPESGKIRLMVMNTARIITARFEDIRHTDVMDNFDRNELEAIYRKAYSNGRSVDTQYDFSDRNEKLWIVYAVFCIIIFLCYVFSNVAAVKPVFLEKLNIIVTPGTFVYPLTFLVIDLLNEFYGFKLARIAIFMCVIANACILGLLIFSLYLPGIPDWMFNSAYSSLIKQIKETFLASTMAFIFSEIANSLVLVKIKKLTNSKFLFIRILASISVAAVLDSAIFCFIAFYKIMSTDDILHMIYIQVIIKLIYAMVSVAPAYGARFIFRNLIIGDK